MAPRIRIATTDTIGTGKVVGQDDNTARLVVWINFSASATRPDLYPGQWFEVSDRVRGFNAAPSGRQFELDRYEAGTGQLVLESRDGDFAPDNAASPFYPYVQPNRPVIIMADAAGVRYPVFAGFCESFNPVWRGPEDEAVVVRLVDAFKVANLASIFNVVIGAWPAETGWQRVLRAAGAGGLAHLPRKLNGEGLTTIAANSQEINGAVLGQLQVVEETENGHLFVSADGRIDFADRTYVPTVATTPLVTFGNHAAEIGYTDLKTSHDDATVRNYAKVTDQLGESFASDGASIAQYGLRGIERSIETADADERQGAAEYLVGVYKDAHLRIDELTLPGDLYADGSAWPWVLGLGVLDRVLVRHTTPTGQLLVQDSLIAGVSHAMAGVKWTATFKLTPTLPIDVWLLGTDDIEGTAVLGY